MGDWFNGIYFLHCANENEKGNFINYISVHFDLRFKDSKECFNGNYLAWRFCEGLHRHQLEIAEGENYWSGKLLEYSSIKDYIEMYIKSMSFLNVKIENKTAKKILLELASEYDDWGEKRFSDYEAFRKFAEKY